MKKRRSRKTGSVPAIVRQKAKEKKKKGEKLNGSCSHSCKAAQKARKAYRFCTGKTKAQEEWEVRIR